MGAQQWAMARIYSAVMGGKAAKVDAKELKMKDGGVLKSEKKLNIHPTQEQASSPNIHQINKRSILDILIQNCILTT
jgi:hypothetical protein